MAIPAFGDEHKEAARALGIDLGAIDWGKVAEVVSFALQLFLHQQHQEQALRGARGHRQEAACETLRLALQTAQSAAECCAADSGDEG